MPAIDEDDRPKQKLVHEMIRTLAHEIPETQRDRTALKLTLRKRQDAAREYFDQLAGKFGRNHCPGRSWQALAHTLITLLPPLTVADLGAGTVRLGCGVDRVELELLEVGRGLAGQRLGDHPRGRVPELEGRPGVRGLVEGDREEDDRELYREIDDLV